MSPEEYRQLLRATFDAYLDQMSSDGVSPHDRQLDYDFSFLSGHRWSALSEGIVENELRGLTNLLNRWRYVLRSWHAWNLTIEKQEARFAERLQWEFLQTLAHESLLKPSSARDSFVIVATKSLHQIRLHVEEGYRDFLDGDPMSPSESPRFLSRKRKESRLSCVASRWSKASDLLAKIRYIDDHNYRQRTFDYRNQHSHSPGPPLGVDQVMEITREVTQADELKEFPDGFWRFVPVPDKMRVGYALGVLPLLDYMEMLKANEEQFHIARDCYAKYRELLSEAVSDIPRLHENGNGEKRVQAHPI